MAEGVETNPEQSSDRNQGSSTYVVSVDVYCVDQHLAFVTSRHELGHAAHASSDRMYICVHHTGTYGPTSTTYPQFDHRGCGKLTQGVLFKLRERLNKNMHPSLSIN